MGGDDGTTTAGDALMLAYAIPTRFESPDSSTVVEFDPDEGIIPDEWERRQEVRGGIETIHGADYGYDPWGGSAPPVMPAQERIRALVENERVDAVLNTLHRIGRGKLWAKLHNDDERWAWAKIETIPRMTLTAEDFQEVPFSIPFTRLSDWFAAEATVVEETVTGNTSFIVESAGLAVTRNIVITLTANSAGGFDQPTIANGSTVESFTIDRVAVAGEVVRIDVEAFRMEHDVGNGMEDVTEDLKLGGTQVMPISLIGGNNLIEVTGITDSTVRIEFYDAWR